MSTISRSEMSSKRSVLLDAPFDDLNAKAHVRDSSRKTQFVPAAGREQPLERRK
jgi:hypothetical protein